MKTRQPRSVRISCDDEIGEIFLHYHSQCIILYRSTRPVVIRVSDIIAMKTRRNTENVVVCLVAVSSGKHVSAAREEAFRDHEGASCSLGRVAGGTVEYWRIECFGYVLDFRFGDGGEVNSEVGFESCFILGEWVHEFDTFVYVVASHDFEGLVVSALEKQLTGKGGCKLAIDNWVFIPVNRAPVSY